MMVRTYHLYLITYSLKRVFNSRQKFPFRQKRTNHIHFDSIIY